MLKIEQQVYNRSIPQFVIKLHLILQKPEYFDYICWNGDSEIIIKNTKKLQEKVLPNYFRHRKTSSFVRQLNMYKFNKVAKLTKEKNYVYFKNEHFKRGKFEDMENIKRHARVKSDPERVKLEPQDGSYQQINAAAVQAKKEVQGKFSQMNKILLSIGAQYPELSKHFEKSKKICQNMLELPQTIVKQQYVSSENDVRVPPQVSFGFITFNQLPSQVDKLYESRKNLNPIRLESLAIFPSYCSIENGF